MTSSSWKKGFHLIYTHGSNVNFQRSACEMTLSDLDQLLNEYLKNSEKLLLGTISLDTQEIHQFGYVQSVHMDSKKSQFVCSFIPMSSSEVQELTHPIDHLLISHEAHFDIIDEQQNTLRYQVAYVTFEQSENELTYFFADAATVENPLAYVAAFWEQVTDVGRDVDFSMVGCSAHDFAKKRKD